MGTPMQTVEKVTHNIILENRKVLSVSGITDVDSFDENTIILYTQLGELKVHGRGLHINNMSVEAGTLDVEGEISAIIYGDKDKKAPSSILSKIFK